MNAHHCHRCERLNRVTFTCGNTGRPIAEQSASGHCPLQKFSGEIATATPIPLAGDLVAAAAARFGADRLAAWWTRQTGKPCGCHARKAWLNRLDQKLRRMLRT